MTTTALTFQSRDDVRELSARLVAMALPGGKKLSQPEVMALAQASVAHGLDPLNGEIWIIPGNGVMIGVKGLRKKAREQVKGNFWIDFHAITSPEERERIGIPKNALAYEARLFDTETVKTYVEAVERMTKAGIPWEGVRGIIGDKPYTSGVGYATPDEPSKMTLVQRAQKRAEADALKRRFDVPFGMAVDENDDDAIIGEPMPVDEAQHRADVAALYPPEEGEIVDSKQDAAKEQTDILTPKAFEWASSVWKIPSNNARIRIQSAIDDGSLPGRMMGKGSFKTWVESRK